MHLFSPTTTRSVALLLGAVCVLLSGCVTTPENTGAFQISAAPPSNLQPGDVLKVDFLYWPELNPEAQSIRPDGKISLQLVGDVEVGGLTPDEVRTKLLDLYKDKLVDPEINVVVSSLESHRVYVGGEVMSPGPLKINGRLTALEAIMQSGGPIKESAKLERVVIVRQVEGKQFARTLDIKAALQNPESEPFLLEPYDVVFVPRTNIDRIDQWVDQYINQLIPRSLHYNFTHEVSSDNAPSGGSSVSDVANSVSTLANL
jgi:protein involved in polysaccharide export with SLBB domain